MFSWPLVCVTIRHHFTLRSCLSATFNWPSICAPSDDSLSVADQLCVDYLIYRYIACILIFLFFLFVGLVCHFVYILLYLFFFIYCIFIIRKWGFLLGGDGVMAYAV